MYPHCSKSCMIGHMTAHTTGKVVKYMSRQDWSQQTKERVYPPLFFSTLQMGRKSVPPTLFPTLQMGRKSGLHSFSPSVRWKSESVPPTLFSHCNKMEKKSVPPTLFFPIIEGEKVQRVRNFTEPATTLQLMLCLSSLVLKPHPAFHCLQYGKAGEGLVYFLM